jgi:hypothetical protein
MNVKNLVLGVGIFILYLLVLNYGFRVFIGAPDWDDFCSIDESRALAEGVPEKADVNKGCNDDYRAAREVYTGKIFLISLIVGIFTLIIGHFAVSVEPVGSALLASGIGAIVFGTLENWSFLDEVWRFVLLVLAFVLVVWFAYRSNSKKGLFGILKK